MKKPSKYGPVESENIRVGVVDAGTPESIEDDHGMAAFRKKRARGGKVTGEAPMHRLDRRARGGKVNGKGTRINIIVAPGGGGSAPGPMAPPPGAGAPPPPTMIRPPPAMPGPGAPPAPMPGPMRKDGGRVPHLTGGAGGGEARMEKIKAYGKNAKGAAG